MLSTLQSRPEPGPGDLGHFSLHVVSRLQLSAIREPPAGRPVWLQISLLFFFFSFPAFCVCLAKLMWPGKRKKVVVKWEGMALSNRERYSTFVLSEKPVASQPTTSQAISGMGTGDDTTTLIPKKNDRDSPYPSSRALCQRLALCAAEPCPQPLENGGIFICIL